MTHLHPLLVGLPLGIQASILSQENDPDATLTQITTAEPDGTNTGVLAVAGDAKLSLMLTSNVHELSAKLDQLKRMIEEIQTFEIKFTVGLPESSALPLDY